MMLSGIKSLNIYAKPKKSENKGIAPSFECISPYLPILETALSGCKTVTGGRRAA